MTPSLELTTTRILNAPPRTVWNAFTDPAHISRWWGPEGFSVTIHKMDFRTNGEWNLTMHGPDGTDYENRKIFLEISPPSRLVMLNDGHPGHTLSVTFEPHEAGTLLTLHHRFTDQAEYDIATQKHGAAEGARQTLNRFAEFLSTL
jgi:uncharacterized protein YndB with AHSA1/START domain